MRRNRTEHGAKERSRDAAPFVIPAVFSHAFDGGIEKASHGQVHFPAGRLYEGVRPLRGLFALFDRDGHFILSNNKLFFLFLPLIDHFLATEYLLRRFTGSQGGASLRSRKVKGGM